MSTSPGKIAANRRNAQLSTGPTTHEGKARSAKNAHKHGILSRETVLPDEDRRSFDTFRSGLLEALAPDGELEAFLSDRVISCAWRLRRVACVEAGLFTAGRFKRLEEKADREARLALDPLHEVPCTLSDALYGDEDDQQERFDPEAVKACEAALDRRQEATDTQHEEPALSGRAFALIEAEGHFGRLSRYETTVERAMYRALHELQRLQAARAGQPVTPPVAVDVQVSSGPPIA